ncbi:uncharacterized protein Z518_08551 [Rhinocladiella mackenziei CBS 650.93]|uniref:Major facilitator superfamily (MFS) profile domain-containing protein n=1 Tax=Rhinocladiella mackenziei CBS 650.93 TaxID=1442369 RepID=A0A0D2I9Q5_9EURO|nr:uncharacterized protein Z518_08551 [Rhinocladiella mackenziei CBS 650.93]KIX02609.1 hypothetical protein Z518_08551 [Rhinocladiella mackenziei CBS 650.93]
MANLTKYNVAICLVVAWGGYSYGFGFAIFVTSIGQPGFYQYFNLDPSSTYTAKQVPHQDFRENISDWAASILGAINALFNFGLAVGALAQGPLADILGRKRAFTLAAVCSLIGAALITGSVAIGMLITVRLLHGFGLGMLICLVPLYLTEVAPPHRRGCAWISIGTYYATNLTVQWRVPLALACIGPLALLIGLPFIPESPRYLTLKGRTHEAWDVLQRIHHDPNDPEDSAAHAEYTQIVRQVEFDKEQEAGYLQMFKKPSWRRRSLLALFIQFAAQSTGASLSILGIANFLVLIFTSLGMTGVMPLLLYAVYSTIGTICVFIAIFTVDKIGRRTMFLIGFPGLAVCLLLEGILQWKYLGTDNKGGLAACLVFIYIYIVIFQCVDGPSFIWMAEIFPTTIRARGISLGFFSYFVGAITYTTPSALAFKNIKYRMYFLYMGLCIISTIIVYFYVPETKQIPVEEIGALFGDEVVVHLTADGHGIVEEQKMVKVEGASTVVHTEKV